MQHHALQPVGLRHRVIVEKGDDIAARQTHAGVARAGKPSPAGIGDYLDVRVGGRNTGQKAGIVVDHDQRFAGFEMLSAKRSNRRVKLISAFGGVSTDDDGN